MPWRLQAMKDVAACEKLRGAGKRALIRRYPNGETRRTLQAHGASKRASEDRRPKTEDRKRVSRSDTTLCPQSSVFCPLEASRVFEACVMPS